MSFAQISEIIRILCNLDTLYVSYAHISFFAHTLSLITLGDMVIEKGWEKDVMHTSCK